MELRNFAILITFILSKRGIKQLTNPQFVKTVSIIPAVNVAQFNEPLSFGTLINLLTNGSFSII